LGRSDGQCSDIVGISSNAELLHLGKDINGAARGRTGGVHACENNKAYLYKGDRDKIMRHGSAPGLDLTLKVSNRSGVILKSPRLGPRLRLDEQRTAKLKQIT